MVKLLHGTNSPKCCFCVILSFLLSHYTDSKLCKSAGIPLQNISCPASPDSRQSRTMRHIKHTAQLVLQLMTCPVPACRSTSGQTIMRQASCPHHLCSCFIIVRLLHKDPCILHNCPDQMLTKSIRKIQILFLVKITLHGMHHNVHAAAGRLILWKSHCKLRIHHSKSGTAAIISIAAFQPSILIGDHRRIAHF